MNGEYARLLDGEHRPTERTVLAVLGARVGVLWKRFRAFIRANYDFEHDFVFGGKKYGWCLKYRRKGKTLCGLLPESKAFTVLVVLGKKEILQFEEHASDFNDNTRSIFESAFQYHDGKWMYKRVLNKSDLEDAISLVRIKKRGKDTGT